MKKSDIWAVSLLLICAVSIFILNFFTPLLHDDFAYLYKFGPKADFRPTAIPIRNISDIFESQYYHYLDVNGRFFSHFLLQFFLFAGKGAFNVVNTVIFFVLIFFTYRYSKNSQLADKNKYLLLFILCGIWFLSPFIGQTTLWMTGSVNYLWSSCFVVIFLYYFKKIEKINESPGYVKLLGLFICSFLIGGTNESVTFGIAAALFIFAVFNFKKLNVAVWVMIIGFGFGVLGIVLSPGTFNRVGNEIVGDTSLFYLLKKKIISVIVLLYFLKYSILISFCLVVFLRVKRISVLAVFKSEMILLLSIVFNCILLMVVENIEERMLFGITVLWLLFNTKLLAKCLNFFSASSLFLGSIILSGFLGFSFFYAISEVNDYNKKNFVFENQMKNKRQKVFYFPQCEDSRFVYHTTGGISDSKNYHNRIRSFYYGVSEVNILPENLYRTIHNNLLFQNDNTGSNVWRNKLLWLKNDHVAVIKFRPDFKYSERIRAKFIFSNGKEKMISVSVVPIENNYYAFINATQQDIDAAVVVFLIDSFGKVIQKVENLHQ